MLDGIEELANDLGRRLSARAWVVRVAEGSVRARPAAWPPQMEILLDPFAAPDRPGYALAIDFRSLPFLGERFKDIFNHDREELFALFGSFRVWQRRASEGWGTPVGDRAFLGGFGMAAGIARQTTVCLFERTPQFAGPALAERFMAEASRLEEVGGEIAGALQRVYQRTVLASTAAMGPLFSDQLADDTGAARAVVPASPAVEAPYPWRR